MLRDFGLEAEMLDQIDEQSFRVAMGANQPDLMSLARTIEQRSVVNHLSSTDSCYVCGWLGLQAEKLNSFVDCVLGHLSVRRPLATCTGKQARIRGCDEVISDQRFCVFGLGVFDKRTDT